MPVKPTPEIDALIRATAAKYKIPYELLYAQVQQESAFNPLAVSHCGARGLMQIMSGTWKDITGRDADSNGDIFDPAKNLDAGARYDVRMYQGCKRMIVNMPKGTLTECTDEDCWKLGLASYNGGFGYVIKAVNLCRLDGRPIKWDTVAERLGDPRLWIRVKGKLRNPDEKQMTDYVARIWAQYEATTPARRATPPYKGGELT